MDPADFASLLEREPQEAFDAARSLMDRLEAETQLRLKAEDALSSAAERIKSLEGVLVAIRAGLITIKNYAPGEFDDCTRRRNAALDRVLGLIGETLDPCKPWCAMEPGHPGACLSGEEMDRDP